MPNKKKSSKKKEKKVQLNVNNENLEGLKRLATSLVALDDKGSNNDDEINIGLSLGHWRDLNDEVEHAYKMMSEGAELIKHTSTKYTLVGKIDVADGSRFSEDLRKGCELISTAALLVHQPTLGCSRPLRKYIKHHSRSVVLSVISLIESFVSLKAMDKNTGAQKTGAVWSACDEISTKLPKGNRACMRREVFTWVGDCNETMKEFQGLVDLGSCSTTSVENENNANDNEYTSWNDFGGGDQYTDEELEIAKACLTIIKCSRGVLGLVLKASECAGEEVTKAKDEEGETRSKAILQWISNAHELARVVGESVTDLGMLLYPALNLEFSDLGSDQEEDKEGEWLRTEIGQQILQQTDAVKAVANHVHDHLVLASEDIPIKMSEEVMELASKLLSAIDVRKTEAEKALSQALHMLQK